MFSSAVAATYALLLRRLPRLRGGAPRTALSTRCLAAGFSTDAAQSHDGSSSYSISAREIAPDEVQGSSQSRLAPPPPPPSKSNPWVEQPEYMQWKRKEKEILEDIDDIVCLTKEMLHSNKYRDGERLNAEDEKEVTEKLLAYHPHSEDKIGCGLDSIMVDRHPEFRNSRCLFVVRTDGVWIDFSYQKCLRAYIREKYPAHSEKFIREHFKRT